MSVLVLSHLLPYPATNGAKMRIFNLVRQLAAAQPVVLLCPVPPGSDLAEMRARLGSGVDAVPVAWPREHSGPGWREYLRSRPSGIQPLHASALGPVEASLRVAAPDLMLATDPVLGEYLRPFSGVRRAIDIAAEYGLYLRRQARLARPAGRPRWWLRAVKWAAYTRSLASSVDVWVVPGEVDRRSLARQLPSGARIAVVPNGVDLDANPFSPNLDTGPQVAHTGAPSYLPNRDALGWLCRDIWPRVQCALPEANLVATGSPSGFSPASAQRFTLTGHLADVRPVVTASRAVVVPLRLGVGTRLKVAEALALGTPVVSTSLGVEGLDVVHDEHVLIADDAPAFAAQVIRVLESRELRVRLGCTGRSLVEARYGWDSLGACWRAAFASGGDYGEHC